MPTPVTPLCDHCGATLPHDSGAAPYRHPASAGGTFCTAPCWLARFAEQLERYHDLFQLYAWLRGQPNQASLLRLWQTQKGRARLLSEYGLSLGLPVGLMSPEDRLRRAAEWLTGPHARPAPWLPLRSPLEPADRWTRRVIEARR
jgi:hypothetical protein